MGACSVVFTPNFIFYVILVLNLIIRPEIRVKIRGNLSAAYIEVKRVKISIQTFFIKSSRSAVFNIGFDSFILVF